MKRRKLLQMLAAGSAFYGPWKVHHAWAQAGQKKPLVIGLTMDASGQFGASGTSERMGALQAFVVLVAFLGIGLTLEPRTVPSPLIDKPAPGFSLPRLSVPQSSFSPEELRGKVWLLNVWASWCVACRDEHPALLDLARTNSVLLYGLNYKDERDKALAWLGQLGNPYVESFSDLHGLGKWTTVGRPPERATQPGSDRICDHM